jgi:polysaccharide export outer membrane protein
MTGPYRTAGAVVIALAALSSAACAGAGAWQPASSAQPPAITDGTATLNSRLLTQVSSPTGYGELPIGPGDLVEISVFEVEELSDLKVRVPLGGSVTLPLLGAIPAAGRTAQELEAEIKSRLQQRFMHDPQVSVFVAEQKSQRVSVLGAVRRGGVYPVTSQLRLADALALAEGLTDDADHVIYLIRRVPTEAPLPVAQAGPAPRRAATTLPDGATEEVMAAIDLEALATGRDELNVPLRAGDVVQVPRAGSYYVGGEVERPGSFFLKSRTTLQQAITAAGGVSTAAAWGDIRIYRVKADGEREVMTFDLSGIEKGAPSPDIRRNDVVVVGKSRAKAFFFGVADFFKGIFGFSKGL